jgi:hypothetical protein
MTRLKTTFGTLFLALLLSAPMLQAQTAAEDYTGDYDGVTMVWGVKGGLGVATPGDADSTADSRSAFLAGGFGTVKTRGLFGFQVEALYSRKGYKTGDGTVTLDYMEFPMLATVNVPRIGRVKPLLMTGPSFGIKSRVAYSGVEERTQNLFKDDVRGYEVGWVVAAGVDVPLGRGGLLIEGRYNVGLTPVLVNNSSYSLGSDKMRTALVLVGYRF